MGLLCIFALSTLCLLPPCIHTFHCTLPSQDLCTVLAQMPVVFRLGAPRTCSPLLTLDCALHCSNNLQHAEVVAATLQARMTGKDVTYDQMAAAFSRRRGADADAALEAFTSGPCLPQPSSAGPSAAHPSAPSGSAGPSVTLAVPQPSAGPSSSTLVSQPPTPRPPQQACSAAAPMLSSAPLLVSTPSAAACCSHAVRTNGVAPAITSLPAPLFISCCARAALCCTRVTPTNAVSTAAAAAAAVDGSTHTLCCTGVPPTHAAAAAAVDGSTHGAVWCSTRALLHVLWCNTRALQHILWCTRAPHVWPCTAIPPNSVSPGCAGVPAASSYAF